MPSLTIKVICPYCQQEIDAEVSTTYFEVIIKPLNPCECRMEEKCEGCDDCNKCMNCEHEFEEVKA